MLCPMFVWNRPSGSWEKDLKISSMYFRYFIIISSRKRAWPFIWKILNSHHPRMLCAKFGWNWPCGSGDFINVFFLLIRNYLPLEKGVPLYEQTWIPITQGHFVLSLVEIGLVVLEKKMKMWKVYNNFNDDDDHNNKDGQRTNWDQKSSLEPSAQVS